jgi:RHS repeat-associated protein
MTSLLYKFLFFALVFFSINSSFAQAPGPPFYIGKACGNSCVGVKHCFYAVGESVRSWSTGGESTPNEEGSISVTWSTAGNKTVTATSISGRTATFPITINNPQTLTASFTMTESEICEGEPVTFTASSNESSNLYYWWYINGSIKESGTSNVFTTDELPPGNLSVYVRISYNADDKCYEPVNSTTKILTVNEPLELTAKLNDPGPIWSCDLESYGWNVNPVSPPETTTYSWFVNNAGPMSGSSNTPKHVFVPLDPVKAGDKIKCLVSTTGCYSPASLFSNEITVVVKEPPLLAEPSLEMQISAISICEGDDMTFSMTSNGSVSNVNWNAGWTGSIEDEFTIPFTSDTEVQLQATVSISGRCHPTKIRQFNLSSNSIPITVTPHITPTVSIDVNDATICEGEMAIFTADPVNGGTPNYSWRINGDEVYNGPNGQLQRSNLNDEDVIDVIMTSNAFCRNDIDQAESNEIEMRISGEFNVSLHDPGPIWSCDLDSYGWSASSSHVEFSTYNWYVNTTGPMSGDPQTPKYVYLPLEPVKAGDEIQCKITSTGCLNDETLETNIVTVQVKEPTPIEPSLEIQTSANSICEGDEITFWATSNGSISNINWNAGSIGSTEDEFAIPFTNSTEVRLRARVTISASDCLPTQIKDFDLSTNDSGHTTVNPWVTPEVTINADYTNICSGQTVNFTASPIYGGNPVFSWKVNNNEVHIGTETEIPIEGLGEDDLVSVHMISDVFCKTEDIVKSNNIQINLTNPKPFVPSLNKKCGIGMLEVEALGDFDSFAWFDNEDNPLEGNSNTVNIELAVTNVPFVYRVKAVYNETCDSDFTEFTTIAVDNCENYIHETTIIEEGHLPTEDLIPLSINVKDDSWTYFDGLGRNMQSIAQQSTPGEDDLIQPIIYDEHGREVKTYLPYVQTGENNGYYKPDPVKSGEETEDYHDSPQYRFYETHFNATVDDPEYPYAQKQFEASPLSRIVGEAAPGKYWHFGAVDDAGIPTNAQIKYEYKANEGSDVRLWEIDYSIRIDDAYDRLVSSRNYDASEIRLNVITDENGAMTCEYKDKQNKVILKKVQIGTSVSLTSHVGWACTYYVYDDFGSLRYVISPQAVQNMVDDNNWTNVEQSDFIHDWLFYYEYDERGRLVVKKIPGAESVYLIYDDRDRLILSQDGNQRIQNEWIFTKYDVLNRPIITGRYTHTGPETSQSEMQEDVVNVEIAAGTDFYEEQDITREHGYTNQMFPTTNTAVHSVTYYDNYSFLDQSWFDAENLNFDYDNSLNTTLQPTVANTAVKGQVTGSKVKVLDPNGVELYLNTVTYYDDRYRMIQTITENHLGSTERTTSCFDDLSGNVKESYITSTMTDAPSVHRRFHYDHAQRLEYVEHSIDGGNYVKTVQNHYNELGELIKKDLHQEDGNAPWQSVDYQYNIRGWLTNINDAALSTDPGDLFGMELYYASGFDVPMYNGNISGVKWKSAVDDDRMAYGYTYDKLNRIVSADYIKGTNPAAWKDEGYYNMEIRGEPLGGGLYESGYDLNGNILNLKRYGVVDKHQAAIDVLTYDYANGNSGNQLLSVSDGGTDEGFKDGTTDINSDGVDYQYDANGNMIADDNKEIENIVYNFMNLPMVIDMIEGRKIEYIYDAAGIKLVQRVYEDETKPVTKVTDYIGERVYEAMADGSQELQFLHHEEGRIVPGPQLSDPDWTPDAPDWEYQYHLKDHLGNTRLTFGAPTEDVFTLTMEVVEPENRIIEDREFENVTISEDNRIEDHNRTPVVLGVTPDPEYVVKLDGVTKVIGPAKSFEVLPGDEININVWAKYLHAESYDPSVAAEALLGGFFEAFINYGSEMLISKGYVNGPLLTGLENIPTGKNHDGVPEAYINYIVFDKNYDVVNGESKKLRISDEGKYGDGSLGTHEHLVAPPINITKAGYIYIYLSNHTPLSEVIFDDLTIKHAHSTVIQKNDYYPFGLSIAGLSSQRDNSVKNNFLYNGKELQSDLNLDWYDYGARMYDASIGRWHVVDPLSDSYFSISPYNYVSNNPIRLIDPNGMEIEEASRDKWDELKQEVIDQRNTLQSKIDKFNSKAKAKGWSKEKLNKKIGNRGERVASLNNTIGNFGVLENSTQVYSLNSVDGELGGTTYDTKTGSIVIGYGSTENFVHESTHAFQFETGAITFSTENGSSLLQDLGDEVDAYTAQFAFKPSSVSGLTSSSKAKSFGGITSNWVLGITASNGDKPYAQDGFANTGRHPIDINSVKADFVRAYPSIPHLKMLSKNYSFLSTPNVLTKTSKPNF